MKMNPEKYAIEKASKMSKDEKMSFVGEKVLDIMDAMDVIILMGLWMLNQLV